MQPLPPMQQPLHPMQPPPPMQSPLIQPPPLQQPLPPPMQQPLPPPMQQPLPPPMSPPPPLIDPLSIHTPMPTPPPPMEPPHPQQPYPSGPFAIDPAHAMHVMGFPQTGPHAAFPPQSTGPHPYPPQPTGPHPFVPVPTGQHPAFPPVPTGQHSAFPPVPTGQYPRPKRPTKPPRPTGNRILVIAASALLVAVFGGAAYIVFGGLSDEDEDDDTSTPPTITPQQQHEQPATTPQPSLTGDAGANAGSATPPTTDPPAPVMARPPDVPGGVAGCVVDVASTPSGAEVVLDANVLGVTPARVSLPCDAPIKLLVRKQTYVAQQRAVTPSRDAQQLKISLVHVSYTVKVSSSPPGATITLAGKSLGTTPATIKLPAFENSTLSIGKDGYSTETEQVTPKTNNQTVHSTLKKAAPIKKLK